MNTCVRYKLNKIMCMHSVGSGLNYHIQESHVT